ncbi:MAG: histidine triad nucleotide-binding protein [Ktedonobacterales bacterium]
MSGPSDTSACLFCGIANGTIPATLLYSDDQVVAFRDLNPQAPLHVLVIPRAHITGADDPRATQGDTLAAMVRAANTVARHEGVAQSGYRLVLNVGPDAGQTVFHLHLHLLGGRPMAWPPG